MEKALLQKGKILHNLFEITIFVKGINGIWEIALGALLLFFKTDTIDNIILALSRGQIIQKSGYFATNYLTRQADHFSPSTQYFLAAYFLFYGAVNIFLVVFLVRGKLWAYPAAMVFFMAFIGYQCYRFSMYHSWLLLFFTVFDVFLVALTFLEYKRIKRSRETNTAP